MFIMHSLKKHGKLSSPTLEFMTTYFGYTTHFVSSRANHMVFAYQVQSKSEFGKNSTFRAWCGAAHSGGQAGKIYSSDKGSARVEGTKGAPLQCRRRNGIGCNRGECQADTKYGRSILNSSLLRPRCQPRLLETMLLQRRPLVNIVCHYLKKQKRHNTEDSLRKTTERQTPLPM